MPLNVPKLQRNMPIAGDQVASPAYQIWWQQFVNSLIETINGQQDQLTELEEQLALIVAVTNRDKLTSSYTKPTRILTVSDAGATATITIEPHRRIYSDGTFVDLLGGSITGLAFNTTYTVFYVDTTLADTTPTFQSSTDIEDGYPGAAEGLHVLGVIMTGDDGAMPITGGGAYAPGGTVGGEIV